MRRARARRKESEEAYDELQKILAANLEHSEQLKAEYAVRAQESEQAALQSLNNQLRVDSLERDIKSRDENIAALNAEIEQSKLGVGELATAKAALVKRVDELAQELAAGSQQMQTLRDDLRMSQDQLRLAQEQSSDRSSQLASSQEALDQKSRQVEQLADELRALQKDSARLRVELDTLAERATELGRLRGEAMAESERLKLALTAQEDLRAKLENELRAKQATADWLERSVDRITDLGASLAALDQQMNGSAGVHYKRTAEPTDTPLRFPPRRSPTTTRSPLQPHDRPPRARPSSRHCRCTCNSMTSQIRTSSTLASQPIARPAVSSSSRSAAKLSTTRS